VPLNLILVDLTAAVSSGVEVLHIYECEILRSLGNIDAMSWGSATHDAANRLRLPEEPLNGSEVQRPGCLV